MQEAYRLYREGALLVNRKYQRKLVWTIPEKQKLIGSLLKGFPIPLILLAERPELHGPGKYEIIDGMQRFNAIFSFIENRFAFEDKYFDVKQFTRAQQMASAGVFEPASADVPVLSAKECADFLDYQIAVTIYPTTSDSDITEVFGRINSGGRQLSNQDRRQAGVATAFADLVRNVASELRGDVSKPVVLLPDMPAISVESGPQSQGYGVRAEDTFWCKQGIISTTQLRNSEDEEIIADLAASILLGKPIPASREYYDKLYSSAVTESTQLETQLAVYGSQRLSNELKSMFSVLRETVEGASQERNALRKTVSKSANPIKTAFYAIGMAFFQLVVREEQTPIDPLSILNSLKGLGDKIVYTAHYATTEDRQKNIDLTRGLLARHFVKKEPSALKHGPGLVLDFENSLRRSKIETARYEFKQGILNLAKDRSKNKDLLDRIVETICGIANVGPGAEGYLYIGVANVPKDAERIAQLDGVNPIQIGDVFVVGVEREAKLLNLSLENYVTIFASAIKSSLLSEPLKSQVLAGFDTVSYRGLSVIRITIPKQEDISFVGEDAFVRDGPNTDKVTGPKMLAISKLFRR